MAVETKVALITGANKGIGIEIARQLGKLGITVIVGARDAAKGEAAAAALRDEGIDAHNIVLDMTSESDIAAVPGFLAAKFGRLDILVNNAGVLLDREGVTPRTFRDTYETNVIGPYFLTQAVLPLLKAAPAGRIVNQSSILGSITVNAAPDQVANEWLAPAYNSSKAALNMLTVIQSRLVEGTNIKVNAAHPGWVKTDLGTDAAPMNTTSGARTAVRLATLPEDGPTGGLFQGPKVLPW
jgi:NAD(P)-dependent dehydrogenase (short-subunit alcohol dehydrogenase family)